MTKKQKIILWIGIALFVLVGFNPRFYTARTTHRRTDAEISKLKQENQEFIEELKERDPNYRHDPNNRLSLLIPIEPSRYVTIGETKFRWGPKDTNTLFCYWIMIAVITGGLLVTFKNRKDG